jgi:hypothetical protein
MRTIFFKITSLLQHPVLPVFVFGELSQPGEGPAKSKTDLRSLLRSVELKSLGSSAQPTTDLDNLKNSWMLVVLNGGM